MREIKLESNKLKLNTPSGEELLSFPSVTRHKKFEDDLLKADGTASIAVFKKFFTDLGMSKKTFDMLEMVHLKMLLTELSEVPK